MIPTFNPGDRVLVTPKPNPEYACEGCGTITGLNSGPMEAVIADLSEIQAVHMVECPKCGHLRDFYEGEYPIWVGEEPMNAPYTWMTLMEGTA